MHRYSAKPKSVIMMTLLPFRRSTIHKVEIITVLWYNVLASRNHIIICGSMLISYGFVV